MHNPIRKKCASAVVQGAYDGQGMQKIMQEERKIVFEKIAQAEMVLVGIGENFVPGKSERGLDEAYKKLAALLEGKNYFVITTSAEESVYHTGLRADRIVRPLAEEEREPDESEAESKRPSRWDMYTKWIQGTLHKRLVVLELGAGMKYPDILRFPFERIVYFNRKAELIRVHNRLYQLPAELKGRGVSVPADAVELLAEEEI